MEPGAEANLQVMAGVNLFELFEDMKSRNLFVANKSTLQKDRLFSFFCVERVPERIIWETFWVNHRIMLFNPLFVEGTITESLEVDCDYCKR